MPLYGKDILFYEKNDGIVTITINRPERYNSLTVELFQRMNEAWLQFKEDNDARVAIITGTGDKAFCCGTDLKEQADRQAEDPSFDIATALPALKDPAYGTPRGVRLFKPTIAAINGIATGGGFELAMECDIRIASETAKCGVSEVKWGRGTPWICPLVWQMPQGLALEIVLTGELKSAQWFHEVGWINKVVPPDQLMPEALKLAQAIRDNAPLSVRAVKELLCRTADLVTETGSRLAGLIYEPVYSGEDSKEGPKAFAEKRKPVWKGR